MYDIYSNCILKFFVVSALKIRYEVAPRSDSEESGSEYEEEVSDLILTLINRH